MDEAEQLADQVVVVDPGRVVADGSPQELTPPARRDTLRFRALPGLDVAALAAALPAATRVEESAPGRYRVTARSTRSCSPTVTSWCAAHGVMPEGLSVGAPLPRGRLPGAHRQGAARMTAAGPRGRTSPPGRAPLRCAA